MSKLLTMHEAIARYVPDGTRVALGLAFETMIPFAAGHEIIRQRRQHLTLIGPISDILFDQLIGAGCADKVIAAWVGNNNDGIAHCYRRAVEQAVPKKLSVEEHSSYTITLALLAASLGSPYIPTYSVLGSDLPTHNPMLRICQSPLNEEPILVVPALRPDVAIIHVQRSDSEGNAHLWGNVGICEEAMLAACQVILVAEEIVSRQVIVSDPNRVIGPSLKVKAVVHAPFGAYPSPVQGYYNRDHRYFHDYHESTQTADGFQKWVNEWVLVPADHQDYLDKLGKSRLQQVGVRNHHYAAPVDYGY